MPLDYIEFSKKIKTKYPEYSDVDDLTLARKMVEKYPEYKNEVTFGDEPVKKKEVSQSIFDQGGFSSAMSKMAQNQPSVSSDSDNGIYLNPDNNQNYKKLDKTWYKDVTGTGEYREMKSGDMKARSEFLNKNAVRIADLNGNKIEPTYKVDTEVDKQYNITPEKIKKEEVLRTKELSKKPIEEKPFTPAIADGRVFDVSNEQEKVDFEKAHFDYVKSGKQQKDLEVAKKEKDLENVLNSVTTDLIGSNQDEVVSKLQDKLKNYDYLEVTPAGFGYDGIEIKNKITKESKFINLDNWTTDRDSEESKILKGFLEVNIVNDEYIKKQKQVDDLREKIEAEKKTNPYNVIFLQKQLNELVPQLDKERAKKLDFMSKDQYRSAASFDKYEIERINNNITKTVLKKEDIKKNISELNEWDKQVKESYRKGLITEEEYNTDYLPKIDEQRKEIDGQIKLLKDDYKQSVNEQSAIQDIAGNAFNVESKRGNVLSGAAFSFVQGMEQATRILTEEEGSRGSDKGVLTSQFAPQSFSEEYLSSGDLSTFETIVNGLANSGGSALAGAMTGGPVGSTLGLYASSYTNFMDQMSGPEFADVSELEKILLAGSVGAVTSQLEKFGLTKAFSKSPVNKKITNYIFSKSLKGLPSDATAEMIDTTIEKEIKGLVANKVLKITGAGVIEYSTEASQELTEIGAKELLNQVKDKEYFKNPKTFGEVFELANKAGMLGLIGGAGMQSLTQATMTAKDQLSKYQVNNIENTINNKEIKDLFVLNIKDRILSGEITKKQGEAELNSLRESEGVLTQIPDNISSEDRYKSFKLINERNEIQKQVQGKDPALVTAQTERINVINEELKNISKLASTVEAERVATAESTTQGITEEGQKEEQEVSQKEIDDYKSSLTRKIEYAEKNGGDIYLEEYKTDLKELNEDPNTFFAKKRIDDEIRDVQIQSNRTRADLADKVKLLMDKRNALESEKRNSILFTKKNELKSINEEIKKTEDELTAHNTKESNDVSKLEKRKALEVERVATETTTTSNTQEVETLRAKEQEEIRAKFPNAEYKADGKIDADKLSAKDRKAFDKIYAKYDKLISPLLEAKGKKEVVSGIEIVMPTEQQAEERKAARSTSEYVDNAAKDLPEISVEEMKEELNGEFGMLSGENPMAKALTEEENVQLNNKAVAWLQNKGYNPKRIIGKYGQAENSFFVPGLKRADAIAFAKEFNQDSVAHSDGLVYQDGSMNPRVKENDDFSFGEYTPESDYVSVVRTPEGLRTVSVGYDFENKISPDNRTLSDQDNLITQDNFEEQRSKQTTAMGQRIVTAAKLVMKALPGIKIYVHQTTAEFENGIGQKLTKASKGAYDNGEIHINLESGADLSTLYHEAIHYALEVKGIESGAILDLAKGLQSIVSDKSIKDRLANLIEVYNENEKAEEYIVELGAIMAEAKKELTTTKFQQFKNLINRIAKKLGLPVIFSASANAKNAVDFMNSLIKAIRTGEEIKAEEVTKKGKIKFQYDFSDPLSKLTFVYDKNGEKFNKLKKEGYITDDKNLSDFEGKSIFLHQPDAAFSGMIYKDGEILVEGKGGVFYPIKFHDDGYFWAGTSITSDKMTKDLNKVFDQNNGTIYMALTSAPYDKLMSSTTMSNAVLDFFSSKAFDNNFKITPAQLKVALRKAANDVKVKKSKDVKTGGIKEKKEGLDLRIKDETSLDDIQSQIKTALGSDNSSFADRKNFALELIKLMAENIKNNPKATEQFGKLFSEGIQNKYFKGISKTGKLSISATNMTQAISEMFTEPLLKEDIKRESGGQVYAIIELNSKVKQEPSTKHESYPIAIESENKNNKVKIHILQDRKNWADSFIDPETGETVSKDRQQKLFPTSGVSVMGLQLKGKSNIKFQRISPENSSNYANLTEDGKGNFVFFHRGGNDYEVIKKNSGGTTATSRDEASAISKVGGVAMYYTRPTDSESMVSDTSQYAVKVKNDKVYDFNSDPLNIIKEARDRFNREYPGQAFNPNVQFAYVTKIANEKGYDMTVAEWEGRTRAQSVVEFKPDDVQVTKGNQVVKNFDESYESNTDKGFQSVIPEDKQKKLDAVYAKIYSVRNSEGRYDDLYRLQEESAKLTEDQITDMIVKSDLSQEIKDEYQAVISAPVEKRRTIKFQRVTKVTVNEMAALKDQIRLEARAARQAKADLNAKRKGLADVVRAMSKAGKIKAQQADFLIKRISYLNLDNPVMVDRFVDYAGRVFERAEYQDILSKAFKVRADIRKLLKTKNQAQVVGMAKAFSKIDPSMVDDIDTYMEMADKVKNAVKPSRIKDFDVALKEATNIENISEYTKDEIARQEEIKKKELLATHDYLKEISDDMSLKDIQDIINILKEDPEVIADKEEKIKNFLINRFNLMSGIVQTMFDKGIDPMTGEQIEFDEKQKELMRRVIKMDLNEMSVRDAITIVEGVENFLENNITSGLEAAVSTYEGDTNVKSLVARGKKAREMNLVPKGKVIEKVVPKFRSVKEATGIPAASRALGRLYGEQLFSIPLMFEKMFGGVMNAGDVMNKIGFTKLINGVSNAVKRHAMIVDSFAKQDFYTKKIMNAANVYEVGMVAYLKRSKPGTPQEIKAEFNEKVNKLRKSIKNLIENGSEKEVKMGKIYEEVFNKLNVDSMDIDVILANTSDNNLKAIDWWIEQWGGNYSDLSDISLSVYNTELGSDFNYTPVSINNLSTKGEKIESGSLERGSSFGISTNYTDKKKTGVLMEATGDMGKDQYVNLDFFNNNSNALKGALIDINTASAIRQIDGAMKSEAFRKLIPSNDDRALLEKRLNNYIRRAKGKKSAPKDTIKYLSQFFNYISTLGVGKALGSVAQSVMQTAPMISTIINSGRFDIATKDFNDWLDRTGMSTSNRGLESQSTIESIDRNLEAVNGTVDSILKFAAKANTAYLKFFLSNVDVMVARSAFKSYYLQDLKRRGISTDIDWNTHEVNQESADYADQMVTRQQNVSDPLLAGEFLASDDPTKMLVRKVILPFASFILNQKARMYNDLHTAFSPTSTNEDRVIALRSFVGLLAELTAFQGMGFGIRTLYSMIADYTLGGDDEEEEKKKSFLGWKVTNETYNATKYPVKSIFNDLISPIPIADGLTTAGLNSLLGQLEYLSEKEIKDAVNEKNRILEIKRKDPMSKDQEKEFIENLKEEAKYQVFSEGVDKAGNWGMLNIAYDTYKETSDIIKLSDTGEFMDDYQGRETLKKLLPAQKESLYYDSKIMIAFSLGILPKDFATVVKKRVSKVKKKAVTEKQYERFDEVQKELGRDLKSWEIDMVKDKKEVGTAVDELNFVKRNGGLTESQGREYVKLVKLIGMPTVSDLDRIQRGEKADQILK